ncbi:hypothetical protein KP509_12G027800 [Ceratopteris richardii]|uniref:Protein kinase domain-containing protein n=1 Tax=Ceratopteris richardii TaxID=49495 RepID=A0A8T2TM09_CERRI|nr:hypothetical protein KP509_12G027800 [Ceratopteris richardii]
METLPTERAMMLALLLSFVTTTWTSATASPDVLDVLIAFRDAITADPTGALSSWRTTAKSNQSNQDYCSWEGLFCRAGTRQVKAIQLGGRKLQGTITPLLGQLSSLSYLNLSSNELSGVLPKELAGCRSLEQLVVNDQQLSGSIPGEFANLSRLQVFSAGGNKLSGEIPSLPLPFLHSLNLSSNRLEGELTTQLTGCTALRSLQLSGNSFVGSIPESLGNLSHLAYLDLSGNNFSHSLPASLANCSKLFYINLDSNQLSGTLPESWFRQLHRRLTFFSIKVNHCSGLVPSAIALCSKLEHIELGGNNFTGQVLQKLMNCTLLSFISLWRNDFDELLPPDLGNAFPQLSILVLLANRFYGELPVSLSNCSDMNVLILGFNYAIKGIIPKEISRLHSLSQLDLQYNALMGNIPTELGNASSSVQIILFNNNHLTGSVPSQLGLLPELTQLNFERNNITGSIPGELGNCTKLFLITGYRNLLTGSIPSSFGLLSKLEHLVLDNNLLSGRIPSSLSNCTRITNISLNVNHLEGPLIAASFPSMLYYDISDNRLSGSLPPELGSMTQVQVMDLSFNNLSGNIPDSLASCVGLVYLNLSANQLTGSLPSELTGSLTSLIVLNLSANKLSGSIPASISKIKTLQQLDLSFNSFSGEIPASLGMMPNLSFLNVSYNRLQGEIPDSGRLQSFSSASFIGNPGLCSVRILQAACTETSRKSNKALIPSLVFSCVAIAILTLMGIALYSSRRRKKQTSINYKKDMAVMPTFLRFTLQEIKEATDDFNPTNVLGRGATGVVYKGLTKDGKKLAFKWLNLNRSSPESPFFAEVQTLGQARHRNLVRILGYFYDLENEILIMEWIANGNIDEHIHGCTPSSSDQEAATTMAHQAAHNSNERKHSLSLPDRFKLARGIANGLDYLHHDFPTPIIHLDIKPTNILLDEDLEARIADFGLSRFMQDSAASISASTQQMRGTLGYAAPEYASAGRISPKCDVYSFGVVILELLTGRRPSSDMFTEGETLISWVGGYKLHNGRFHDHMMEICGGGRGDPKADDGIRLHLDIALDCTKPNPKERPTMREVAEALAHADLSYHGSSVNLNDKRHDQERDGERSSWTKA